MLPWNPPASLGGSSNNGGGGAQQQQSQQSQIQPQRPPLNSGSGQWGGPPAPQLQQQQQQQQQQGMQILQQSQQQQQQSDNNGGQQQQSQPAAPITLSSVLHYLQTEWRRYERERNEWEIERGEMRARIALLEGERRGNENLKTDLMRRVKMLEYALRQERNKYLTSAQQNAAAQAAAAAAASAATAAQREKEAKDKKDAAAGTKEGEEVKGEEKKEKIASAIPDTKKKAIAAGTASGRSSPAPPSEDGQSSAGSAGVPEVVVSSSNQANAATASAIPSHLQQQGQSQSNLHRAGSTASLVSLPNGASTINLPGGTSTMNFGGGPGSSTIGLSGSFNPGVGRDPRARAKTREYLKQCLQEITYLTSAAALNPLPERTPGGISRPRKEMKEIAAAREKEPLEVAAPVANVAPAAAGVVVQDKEGNKIVPLDPAAAASAEKSANTEALQAATSMTGSNGSEMRTDGKSENNTTTSSRSADIAGGGNPSLNGPLARKAEPTTALTSADPPKAVADLFTSLSSNDASAASSSSLAGTENSSSSQITAIFRPESSEEWQKALKKAGQTLQQPRGSGEPGSAPSAGEGSLGTTLSIRDVQERQQHAKDTEGRQNGVPASTVRGRSDTAVLAAGSTSTSQDANEHKSWKQRRTLRTHLDATRCLAFDRSERPSDVTLFTGGDDCTVKVWRLPLTSMSALSRGVNQPDSEPAQTYRGHSSVVTSLCTSSVQQRIYSSSLDSTVQVWAIPPKDREPYAPYDPSLNLLRLEGHTDGVWDICLLGGTSPDKEVLASASADGTVKVWDVSPSRTSEEGGDLKLSWTAQGTEYHADEEGAATSKRRLSPTSLALCQSDMRKLAVAYRDSLVRIFDTETGRLVLTLQSNEGYDGTPLTQINRIISHPTLPMLMTAHENKYIRLYDLKSGTCTHSILAHSDGVTSLDVDPSGLTIASSSHDCTVRFWDLLQTRSCIQEISASHRSKGDEGVLDLKYHPTLPFVASAGADGAVRLYA